MEYCNYYLDASKLDGPLIGIEPKPIQPDDTAEILHARIQVLEHRLYPEAIRRVHHDGHGVPL
ncbi:MAG: hypothetical protein EOO77_28095, partial [Oxalobacteraceae bacterium]